MNYAWLQQIYLHDSDGSDSCIVKNFRPGGRQILGGGRGGQAAPSRL